MRMLDWNINGIRASIKKGLIEKLKDFNVDIIAFQEVKCQDEDLEEIFKDYKQEDLFGESEFKNKYITMEENLFLNQYQAFWHTAKNRKGYSGTCLMIKKSLNLEIVEEVYKLENEEFNDEGRLTGIKFKTKNNKIFLLNGYYPQGGREGRVKYKIEFYWNLLKLLQKTRQEGYKIILCGDFNTTVKDIDLARPKENRKTTGCLPEERLALRWLIDETEFDEKDLVIKNTDFNYILEYEKYDKLQLIDTTRFYNPNTPEIYTYWDQITSARMRNVGWRIDYWLVDKELKNDLIDTKVLSEILGSDHCPVLLEINI
jgi:exodeoxyribonuclease III